MGFLLPAAVAFLISVALTPVARALALRAGAVASPRQDRWHREPTPLLGGIAVYVAFVTSLALFLPRGQAFWAIVAGSSWLFLVGLADDLISLRPPIKLIGQIIGASLLVSWGISIEVIDWPPLRVLLTLLWLLVITNAFNLIDNMDGLCAGVALISSAFLGVSLALHGMADLSRVAWGMAGAAAGFLVFNFRPARIFLGDSGSMTLGFGLAALTLVGSWKEVSNLGAMIMVPVLLLGVPIFDTALVTAARTFQGRPISQGGKDHSSHRLVALGLSETGAVLVLYGVAVALGLLALAAEFLQLLWIVFLTPLLAVLLYLFGVFLGQVEVYPAHEAGARALEGKGVLINTVFLYKQQLVEVIVDCVLIAAAYLGAYLLRFEQGIHREDLELFRDSLPLVLVLKLMSFHLCGLYQGMWRHVGLPDLVAIVKAVALGSTGSVAALVLLRRFEGYSRAVFVIDAILLLLLVAGSRVLLRVLHEYVFQTAREGRRVMIVGAGDAGELLLLEIRKNRRLGWVPVCFIDDDPRKQGRRIQGVPVLGGRTEIPRVASELGIEEIVVAIPSATRAQLEAIARCCDQAGLRHRETNGIRSGGRPWAPARPCSSGRRAAGG
ncbi:MAG: hypothetical protein HYY85_19875 [Deltaproteobacteria bacterium]|nr:hypothetical protein [Deltaproteobacteria bacterium]